MAASSNGKSGIAAITVQPAPVASVVVSPPQISVAVGARTTFTAAVLDAGGNALSGRTVTWASSNGLDCQRRCVGRRHAALGRSSDDHRDVRGKERHLDDHRHAGGGGKRDGHTQSVVDVGRTDHAVHGDGTRRCWKSAHGTNVPVDDVECGRRDRGD